mmetsp:Transcript_14125/g.38729  ORF Transcript_14125/g.38729 Transcript_14125/m.38729 type:complete len:201 (-) Transcript_14125:47-649(-)
MQTPKPTRPSCLCVCDCSSMAATPMSNRPHTVKRTPIQWYARSFRRRKTTVKMAENTITAPRIICQTAALMNIMATAAMPVPRTSKLAGNANKYNGTCFGRAAIRSASKPTSSYPTSVLRRPKLRCTLPTKNGTSSEASPQNMNMFVNHGLLKLWRPDGSVGQSVWYMSLELIVLNDPKTSMAKTRPIVCRTRFMSGRRR